MVTPHVGFCEWPYLPHNFKGNKSTKHLQSTLPKLNSHESNNRLSRRSIQVLLSLFSIVFYPS